MVSNETTIQQANFQCFPNEVSLGPIVEVTDHYCGVIGEDYSFYSSSYEMLYTCMCSGDSCNGAIYLPESNPPPKGKEGGENDTDKGEGSGAVITPVPTKNEQPKSNNTPQPNKGAGSDHQTGATTGTKIAIFVLASAIPALILSIIMFVIGYLYMTRCRKHKTCFDSKDHIPTSHTESTSIDLTSDSDTKIIGEDSPSDSPINLQTNCLPLTLDNVIGRGRFGAVWKAHHKHGDGKTHLAVKVFQDFDSASWNVEKELFTDESVTLHHDNVIEFIAAEVRRVGYDQQNKQFWLVTKYYPKGSLQDYLTARTTTWHELCRLSGSAARGLAHLHADVYGSHGLHKIPVAHRDLKSSNVLVKDNGECVIADFGLAIKLDPRVSTDTLANSGQVGTPRYMSPEALESKVNLQDIESFKQMDVFSLALVIWEIATRCTLNSDLHDYYLPYDDLITGYPTVEEMKTIAVARGLRPTIPENWTNSTGMELVANTMRECWDTDPEARLTASCVEARFSDMMTWVEGEQHLGHRDSGHSVTIV
ncbi:TGF-beta receptor type-2-like [Amphiura filiformis]|uniref:TGF-beta receptor type-2-like n=1 Tax=Amphiura filiformis TaxID=82378 RepID=UPI003B2180E3